METDCFVGEYCASGVCLPSGEEELDADAPDSGGPDAPDAEEPDTSAPDVDPPDSSEPDAGPPDSGEPDAAVPDVDPPPPEVLIELSWAAAGWSLGDSPNAPDLNLYYCPEGVPEFRSNVGGGCVNGYYENVEATWDADGEEFVVALEQESFNPGGSERIVHGQLSAGMRSHIGVEFWTSGENAAFEDVEATLTITVDGEIWRSVTQRFGREQEFWYAAVIDWPVDPYESEFQAGPACANDGCSADQPGLYGWLPVTIE